MSDFKKIRRALISLSNKTGVVEFAERLSKLGVAIISTGGTARTLSENGIPVTEVSEITGFPEMMDGRVKTLHPKIHGALLALRDNSEHVASMNEHGIEPIDMVVIDLYPFEKTIEKEGVTLEEAIENIDIGGPAMIRSASKNWRDVAVITDPRLYAEILEEMEANGSTVSAETRRRLATLAYTRTASYDLAISTYLAGFLTDEDLEKLEPLNPLGDIMFIDADAWEDVEDPDATGDPVSIEELPETFDLLLDRAAVLRYGENPHQKAGIYLTGAKGGIATAEQLHGKEMSFNNYVDADAAWALVNDFDELAVAIIKHTNPSGVGIGATNLEAYKKALATDPVSAFGGIVAFNRPVDAETAAAVIEVFTEVVVAPGYDDGAMSVLATKKNLRVLRSASLAENAGLELKQISGGMLIQDRDTHRLTPEMLSIVSEKQPTDEQVMSMLFAWTVCKHVRSNAIVLAADGRTIGVGAGQMNRVDSVRIAALRAERFELPISGSVLASDAFFPFRDNVDEAAKMGVSAIIQPGGSVKDDETIAAANEHGIVMAFTGVRHFKH